MCVENIRTKFFSRLAYHATSVVWNSLESDITILIMVISRQEVYCDRANLLVRWLLVGWLVLIHWFIDQARCDLPNRPSPNFMTFGKDVRYYIREKLLTLERSRSEFKVKCSLRSLGAGTYTDSLP